MNSTEQTELQAAIGQLFDDVLAPIAARMRADGMAAFPLAPDQSWLSYYVRRRRSSMTREDFLGPSCADAADLERRLSAHWHALGRHELVSHVARFSEAAQAAQRLLRSARVDPDLSPYVYAMF